MSEPDSSEGESRPDRWPQRLAPVAGPFSEARIDGAAEGMGDHGPATRSIAAAGHVQPDLITGMTLFLLARQPRQRPPSDDGPRSGGDRKPAKASPIAGGVWVREQFAIHRPLARTDPFEVTGLSTGRYVRKGRRYGTTTATAVDATGQLVSTNLTTGLLSYRAEAGREDEVEGLPLDKTPAPEPDWSAAESNPHREAIASAAVGDRFGGEALTVTLAMMAARDTASPDNPIHSDPEQARQAGLAKPIAGGSHVLSFAIEHLLAAWGPEALSHGTKFDVRWRAPVEAGAVIVPSATVVEVLEDRVHVELAVELEPEPAAGGERVMAMIGSATVPLSS